MADKAKEAPLKAYKIQINYKSGISMTGWFTRFSIVVDEFGDTTYSWETYDPFAGPMAIGPDNIESVWQLEAKDIEK
jgi:hypothetical protein